MGYPTNSPVKQIWLPFDYFWLNETINGETTFGNFAKAYKEKYGIDLHDLLRMFVDSENSFYIAPTVDLLGAYNVPTNDLSNTDIRFALSNCIEGITHEAQGANSALLMILSIGDRKHLTFGFEIRVPVQGTPVNSIDDLKIIFYEN